MPDRAQNLFPVPTLEDHVMPVFHHDGLWGGATTAYWQDLQKAHLHCNLKQSDQYPSCGVALKFPIDPNLNWGDGLYLYARYFKELDLSAYDSIELDFHYTGEARTLRLFFRNNEDRMELMDEERIAQTRVRPVQGHNSITVPLDELKTPEWWLVKNGQPVDDTEAYLNRIVSFGLELVYPSPYGKHEIALTQITVKKPSPTFRDIAPLILLVWLATILYILAMQAWRFWRSIQSTSSALRQLTGDYDNLKQSSDVLRSAVDAVTQKALLDHRVAEEDINEDLQPMVNEINSALQFLNDALLHQKKMSANVAHELRTPVAALLAETESILRKDRTKDEYQESLEVCMVVSRRLKEVLDHISLLSRLEHNTHSFNAESVDMEALLHEIVETLGPLANKGKLTLNFTPQPAHCRAGRELIYQALSCVVANAVHYCHRGDTINVVMATDQDSVTITVSDTGPGIPEEDLPHIFERFFRSSKQKHSTTEHSGLGLAISHEVVTQLGGSIDVTSSAVTGTCFTIKLPLSQDRGPKTLATL